MRKEAERHDRLETKQQESLELQMERHEAASRLEDLLARHDQSELQNGPSEARLLLPRHAL